MGGSSCSSTIEKSRPPDIQYVPSVVIIECGGTVYLCRVRVR